MALTKEDLQAIGALMDSKLSAALEPIKTDLAEIKNDIEIIKEDAAITREASNLLLDWATVIDHVTLEEVREKRTARASIE